MKRKSKKQLKDEVWEELEAPTETEEVEEPKKPDTQPLDTEAYVKFVKCVYNSPVNVKNAPSGTKYSFQPGQTQPVRNAEDYHYLLSLKRNPGPNCCGGANPQPRVYFDVVNIGE